MGAKIVLADNMKWTEFMTYLLFIKFYFSPSKEIAL